MKNTKRVLLGLLAAIMLFGCVSIMASADNDYITYTVKGGDTALGICEGLKIDFFANQAWISEVNNIGSYNNIKVNQVLYLPTFDTSKDPARANKVKEEIKKAAAAAKPAAGTAAPAAVGTTTAGDSIVSYLINYKLQPGETVGSVCAKLGVDFEANAEKIKKLSGFSNYYHVPAGQIVVIPSLTVPEGSSYTQIVAHQVKGGETAAIICGIYKLDFAKVEGQLKALNNTDNLSRISVGQTFYLPVPGGKAGAGTAPSGATASANGAASAGNTAAPAGLTYKITPQSSAHGTFVIQVGGQNAASAPAGSDVKIVAEPEAGYKVYSITVTKTGTNQAFPVGASYFIMPNCDVTVTVTFKTAQ